MVEMQKGCRNNPCQHFGSKSNLNVHLHVLALDGAYSFEHGKARFHRAKARHPEELDAFLTSVITRVTRTPVRAGVRVAEDEQPYLDLEMDSPYEQLAGPPSWTRNNAVARPAGSGWGEWRY